MGGELGWRSRFWEWWLASVFQKTYLRVSLQVAASTLLVLSTFSTPKAWDALSLDPILANPSLILVLTVVELLFSKGTGLSAPQIAVEGFLGSLVGGVLELGVSYLVFGINGGTHNTPLKAVLTILFGSICLFFTGASRFKYRELNIFFLICSMTLGVGLAGSYHMTAHIWKFAVYWWAFVAISGAVTLLVSTLVLPVLAGHVVRKKLARAVRLEGAVLASVLDIMTGELDPASGLLKAASGEASIATGVDSGLEALVLAVHAKSMAANQSLQVALTHMRAATLEWDAYRPTHTFPSAPYNSQLALARTLLSPIMMLFYPVQTGKMRLTLCRQHSEELHSLSAAFEACCNSLADVIRNNAPVQGAIAKLEALEASYVALMRAALEAQWAAEEAGRPPLPNDRLALNMTLSLLFTCCTRLRRMLALLPEALGRDQPGATVHVARHFRQDRGWEFAALSQGSLQGGPSTRRLVKQSLIGPQSSTKALVGQLLEREPPLQMSKRMDRGLKQPGPLTRALRWVEKHTGYTRGHLSLGAQLSVAYVLVMVLLVVEPAYHAVQNRSTWTVFIVLAIHEPLAGSAVWKSFLRISGTVVAGILGLGALYFTVLCNGLSFEDRPTKFIVMTLSLTVLSIPLAAGAVKFGVRNAYFWIISCIVMYTVALPGYTSDHPMPKLALWRLVCTAIGIVVEVACSQLVFPVTARQTYRTLMGAALGGLAEVVDLAFHSVLPSARSSRGAGTGGPILQGGSKVAPASEGVVRGVKGSFGGAGLGGKPLDVPLAVFWEQQHGGAASMPSALPPISEQTERAEQAAESVATAEVLRGEEDEVQRGKEQGERGIEQQAGQQQQQDSPHSGTALPASGEAAAAGAAVEAAAGHGEPGEEPTALPCGPDDSSYEEWWKGNPREGRHLGRLSLEGAPASPAGASTSRRHSLGHDAARRHSSHSDRHNPRHLYHHQQQEAAVGSPRAAGCVAHSSVGGAGGGGLERLSAMSVSSGLSGTAVYARLDDDVQHMIFGKVIVRLRPAALKVAGQIATMGQLMGPLQYEVNPFQDPPRFPIKHGMRAARLCRRALNVITAFAITMDSHETTHIPLLAPHAAQLERLLRQLQESFKALAAMVAGEGTVSWAVRCVVGVEAHLEALLLRVAVQEGGGVSDADAMQGLAFLSMLFNTSYVARLLCIALTHAFFSTSPEAREDIAELEADPARWALDEKLVLLAGEIMGAAVVAPADRAAHSEEMV